MKSNIFYINLLFFTVMLFAQDGETLYQDKCGRCHTLYMPFEYDTQEWPGIVKSMKNYASLDDEEVKSITEFLIDESTSQKLNTTGQIDPTVGGYLYTEYFNSQQKASNFDIHYLALYVSGWAAENIYYYGELELEHGGTGGNNTFVEQAFIDYWILPNSAIKIGAILTPFNRFDDFHGPLLNATISRPQVAREIGTSAWKDVGIDLHGFFNLNKNFQFQYDIYTINGLGSGTNLRSSRQYRDNNENLAKGGRLNFVLNNNIEIGGSLYQGKWDDDGKYQLTMAGTHVIYNTVFGDIYAEYSKAESENPDSLQNGNMNGYFIQISKQLLEKIRPVIRYGELDYLDTSNVLGRSASKGNKDLSELVFGISYFPSHNTVFKIEYIIFDEGSRIQQVNNNQVGFQAAVKF